MSSRVSGIGVTGLESVVIFLISPDGEVLMAVSVIVVTISQLIRRKRQRTTIALAE